MSQLSGNTAASSTSGISVAATRAAINEIKHLVESGDYFLRFWFHVSILRGCGGKI